MTFSIMHKKMMLYVPDLENYKKERGLNILLEDIPGDICKNQDELIVSLKCREYSVEKIKEFKNKYARDLDGHSTERVGRFILNLLR